MKEHVLCERPALSDACQLLVSAKQRAINSRGLTIAQRLLSVEKLTAARGKVYACVGKTKAKRLTLADVSAKAKRLTLADVSAKVSAIIDKKQR